MPETVQYLDQAASAQSSSGAYPNVLHCTFKCITLNLQCQENFEGGSGGEGRSARDVASSKKDRKKLTLNLGCAMLHDSWLP